MTPHQLQEGFNTLLAHIYSPEETAWRNERFKPRLLARFGELYAANGVC